MYKYIHAYIYICIYIYINIIYIYGPPATKAYLSSLLIEGVKSTPCASFLQMPENTVNYSFVCWCFTFYMTASVCFVYA